VVLLHGVMPMARMIDLVLLSGWVVMSSGGGGFH
jgi:hypothetical protein